MAAADGDSDIRLYLSCQICNLNCTVQVVRNNQHPVLSLSLIPRLFPSCDHTRIKDFSNSSILVHSIYIEHLCSLHGHVHEPREGTWNEATPLTVIRDLALRHNYTSTMYQNGLPFRASSGEDEALPDVVLSGHAGGTEVGDEPPPISSHAQLEGIVSGHIEQATFKPQVL